MKSNVKKIKVYTQTSISCVLCMSTYTTHMKWMAQCVCSGGGWKGWSGCHLPTYQTLTAYCCTPWDNDNFFIMNSPLGWSETFHTIFLHRWLNKSSFSFLSFSRATAEPLVSWNCTFSLPHLFVVWLFYFCDVVYFVSVCFLVITVFLLLTTASTLLTALYSVQPGWARPILQLLLQVVLTGCSPFTHCLVTVVFCSMTV